MDPRGRDHVAGERQSRGGSTLHGARPRVKNALRALRQFRKVAASHGGGRQRGDALHLAALAESFVIGHEK